MFETPLTGQRHLQQLRLPNSFQERSPKSQILVLVGFAGIAHVPDKKQKKAGPGHRGSEPPVRVSEVH